MSIAEHLIERGREEGRREARLEAERADMARGAVLGRVQGYQEILGLPISSLGELGAKDTTALELLLRELQARFRLRGAGSTE